MKKILDGTKNKHYIVHFKRKEKKKMNYQKEYYERL